MPRRERTEGVTCAPRDKVSRAWETSSLDEHASLIKRQIDRSLEDHTFVELARKVAAGKSDAKDGRQRPFVKAWGNHYELGPPCEGPVTSDEQGDRLVSTRLWNFVVSNYSYIEDPPSFDLFSTARYVLDAKESADILEKNLESETNDTIRQEVRRHIANLRSVRTLGAGDCDDATILVVALHKAAGFRNCRARIVSTDGEYWAHVYGIVGMPRTQSRELVAFDPTVKGAVPGWEYPRSRAVHDFIL